LWPICGRNNHRSRGVVNITNESATLDANFNSVIADAKVGLLSQDNAELHATNSDFVNNRISIHVIRRTVPGMWKDAISTITSLYFFRFLAFSTLYYLLMQVNAQVQALPLLTRNIGKYLNLIIHQTLSQGLNNGN